MGHHIRPEMRLLIFAAWLGIVSHQHVLAYSRRSSISGNALELSGVQTGNRVFNNADAFLLDMMGPDGFESALDSYLTSGNSAHGTHEVPKTVRKRSQERTNHEERNAGNSAEFWKGYFDDVGSRLYGT